MFNIRRLVSIKLLVILLLTIFSLPAFGISLYNDITLYYDSYGDVWYGSGSNSDTHMNFNFQPTSLSSGDYARSYVKITNDDAQDHVYHYTTSINTKYMSFVDTYKANNYDIYVDSAAIDYESDGDKEFTWYFGNALENVWIESGESASAYFKFQWQTNPDSYNWKINDHYPSYGTLQFFAGYKDSSYGTVYPEFLSDSTIKINQ